MKIHENDDGSLWTTEQITPEQAEQIKAHWLANYTSPSPMLSFGFDTKPRHLKRWQHTKRWAWFAASMAPILTWAHIVAPDAGLVAMGALGVCVGIVAIVEREVGA